MAISDGIPEPDEAVHVLDRIAFGPRPGDLARLRSIGARNYIRAQLNPTAIPIPKELSERLARMRTLRMSPLALFVTYELPVRRTAKGDKQARRAARIRARVVIREAREARMLRALLSPRRLHEVMTAFWFNHFNVFAGKGLDRIFTGSFEEQAIRPYALGRFRNLLGATARHPAMLFYLDNWQNTAPGSPGAHGRFKGINENYARELMELHTLGVDGGYTQQDVIALARILTGWGLATRRWRHVVRYRHHSSHVGRGERPEVTPEGFHFDAGRHDFADKLFLGHRVKGEGQAEGERALDILAESPATAHHLSYQLAQYFVRDDPPEALVSSMASRYLGSKGDIRAVLTTMFSSAEFWAKRNFRAKFKTPYEYVISSARATGAEVRNFRPLLGAIAHLGMPLYGARTPNGYANTRDAWLNPDGMIRRLSFATAIGLGRLPLDRDPAEIHRRVGSRSARSDGEATMTTGRFRTDRAADREAGIRPRSVGIPEAGRLAATLGRRFSDSTAKAIAAAPPRLRPALILGSPEFMKR